MRFLALELSLDILRTLRPVLRKLRSRNRKLHHQIKDAGASMTMNLGEGNRRAGMDRIHLFRIAAGSTAEIRDGLRAAEAMGDLDPSDIAQALALLDRELGMIWGLPEGPKRPGSRGHTGSS